MGTITSGEEEPQVPQPLNQNNYKNRVLVAGNNNHDWSPYANKQEAEAFLKTNLKDAITFVDKKSVVDYILLPNHVSSDSSLKEFGGKNCHIQSLNSFVHQYIRAFDPQEDAGRKRGSETDTVYLAGPETAQWGPYAHKKDAIQGLYDLSLSDLKLVDSDAKQIAYILIPNNGDTEDKNLRKIGGPDCVIRRYQWFLNFFS
jgi:hypothetical protein